MLALLAGTEVAAQQEAVRVDGLAALVGGLDPAPGVDVVLRSDVELYALIELGGDTSGSLPDKPLPVSLMRKALQKLVGEHVIAREAERVRVSEPRASDVARERRSLERRAGGRKRLQALLRRLSVGKRELERILLRRARVTVFLKANLEAPRAGATTRPDRVATAAEQQGRQAPAEQRTDPAAAHALEASLEKAAERWIRLLMVRTPVRFFGEYTP